MSEIIISNKMMSNFELTGYNESQIFTEISVLDYGESNVDVELEVKGYGYSSVDVELEVEYLGSSEILVEVTPGESSSIYVEVEVPPSNRMYVYYEINEPATEVLDLSPNNDTFVSSYAPYNVTNYGQSYSLKVGEDYSGESTTVIKFDTPVILDERVLKSAKVKIYYNSYFDQPLDIFRVRGDWNENSLTYANMNLEFLTTTHNIAKNEFGRFIEIDITELAELWSDGGKNDGIAIKSSDSSSIFKSGESDNPPELKLVYYTTDFLNINNSRILTEITPRTINNSDVYVEVEVDSDYAFSFVDVSLYAHHPDIPLNSDIEVEVTVNEEEGFSAIDTELTVAHPLSMSIDVELEVPEYNSDNDINVEISVYDENETSIEVEVEVSDTLVASSMINVELEVFRLPTEESNDIDVVVEVTDPNAYENGYSDIDVELDVPVRNELNEVEVEVSVWRKVFGEIFVELEVYENNENSDIDVEVEVPPRFRDNSIDVEVSVWGYGDSDIEVEVYARAPYLNYIDVEITVDRLKVNKSYVFMI